MKEKVSYGEFGDMYAIVPLNKKALHWIVP